MLESVVLRALAERGQRVAADLCGLSESRLSRFKSNASEGGGLHLSEVATLLESLGLTIIESSPRDTVTLSRDEHDALRTLARRALA